MKKKLFVGLLMATLLVSMTVLCALTASAANVVFSVQNGRLSPTGSAGDKYTVYITSAAPDETALAALCADTFSDYYYSMGADGSDGFNASSDPSGMAIGDIPTTGRVTLTAIVVDKTALAITGNLYYLTCSATTSMRGETTKVTFNFMANSAEWQTYTDLRPLCPHVPVGDTYLYTDTAHWNPCGNEDCPLKGETDAETLANYEMAFRLISNLKDQLNYTEEHTFDQTALLYKKSDATCSADAVYYYTCVCGAKGTDTFTATGTAGHKAATAWSYDEDEHWHACTGCGTHLDSGDHIDENSDHFCDTCGYVDESLFADLEIGVGPDDDGVMFTFPFALDGETYPLSNFTVSTEDPSVFENGDIQLTCYDAEDEPMETFICWPAEWIYGEGDGSVWGTGAMEPVDPDLSEFAYFCIWSPNADITLRVKNPTNKGEEKYFFNRTFDWKSPFPTEPGNYAIYFNDQNNSEEEMANILDVSEAEGPLFFDYIAVPDAMTNFLQPDTEVREGTTEMSSEGQIIRGSDFWQNRTLYFVHIHDFTRDGDNHVCKYDWFEEETGGTAFMTACFGKFYEGQDCSHQMGEGFCSICHVVSVPTAEENLLYNGEEQHGIPGKPYYNVENGSAILPGNYTASVTPVFGYFWDDGSTDSKDITWRILYTENYLVDAPTVGSSGKYNQRSYYMDGENKVVVEEALLASDKSVTFEKWYLHPLVQTNGNAVRFISMLDSALDIYAGAGFNVTVKKGGETVYSSNTAQKYAYESIIADGETVSPADYGASFFFTDADFVASGDMVAAPWDYTVTVSAFVQTKDSIYTGAPLVFTLDQLFD